MITALESDCLTLSLWLAEIRLRVDNVHKSVGRQVQPATSSPVTTWQFK